MFDPRGLFICVVLFVVCVFGLGWFGHDAWHLLQQHLHISWK